jgi:hypothetical protein
MRERSVESLNGDIRALKELKSHRGWEIVMETIKEEILSAALQFADNPLMSEKEVDFRRGAIHASRSVMSVVDVLIAMRENDKLLASAEEQTLNPLNALA